MTKEERINKLIDTLVELGVIKLTDEPAKEQEIISQNEYVSI